MEKYYFQAVNGDGKNITGTIEAESESLAHEKLSQAHLAVLSLEIYDEALHANNGGILYEFEGTNKEGKIIKGTITGREDYEVYKQLRNEYDLEVAYLVPSGLSPEERGGYEETVFPDLEARFQKEIHVSEDSESGETLQKKDEKLVAKTLKLQEKQQAFLSEQISQYTDQLKALLHEHELFLNPEKRRILQGKIDQLDRIKYSNNVAHLKVILKELFDSFTEEALFLSESEIDSALQSEYQQSKKALRFSVGNFKGRIDKGLKAIERALGEVALKKVVQHFSFTKMVATLGEHIYFTAMTFLFISFLWFFIVFVVGQFGVRGMGDIFKALAVSLLTWYFLGLAILIVILGALDLERQWKARWHRYAFKAGVFLLVGLLYTINAPTIYFWTL